MSGADGNMRPLRILHVANFQEFKYGQWYMSLDSKLSQGLTQLGHCVLPFSHRDVARAENPFKSKSLGAGVMNRRLLQTIDNLQPELVLVGHSELVTTDSLRAIRERLPDTRMAMWYCDPLFHEHGVKLLRARMEFLDALFTTTGGELLRSVGHACTRAHIPNWVFSGSESGRAFANESYQSDLVFAGSDYHEPARQGLLSHLRDNVPGLRFRIFQALGNPRIHGRAYYQVLENSLMGLSLSRRSDVTWYSSDRLQQMMGNGLCTLSPRTEGLTRLFTENELVWFDDEQDLIDKAGYYAAHPDEARRIGEAGWRKVHQVCSARRIARFMLEVIYGTALSERYEWGGEVYTG